MDTNQVLGVDPVKSLLIGIGAVFLTDMVKTTLKLKGWGVVALAFFVALFLSVLWIVPWTTHQETDALLAALKTALLTAIASVTGGEARGRLKDYWQNKRTETPVDPAPTPAVAGESETRNEQAE